MQWDVAIKNCLRFKETKLLMVKLKNCSRKKFELGQVDSLIFVRPKKEGSYRIILNLKALNKHVEYRKYKMENCSQH